MSELVSSRCWDGGERGAQHQNQSTTNHFLDIHISSPSKSKRILKDRRGKGKNRVRRANI